MLSAPRAAFFERVARRELVSAHLAIRTLLYLGVLLLTTGVGILVAEHHRAIGPWVVAGSIGLAAAACLVWVARTAPPFSWGEVPSPGAAFDYLLLLGLLLLAAGLAYAEAQFAVLGPRWPHHLLVVGTVYLLAAYRWDSRTVLGLALSTLAAWRGLSIGLISGAPAAGDGNELRWNALALGALYTALGVVSVRWRRKPHFEEVWTGAGLLLLLGALASGALGAPSTRGAWGTALLAGAGLVMWVSFRLGRSLFFALGVLAAYVGLLRLLFASHAGAAGGAPFLAAALLGIGALALIWAAHRRMAGR